jgi:hypothetical protein
MLKFGGDEWQVGEVVVLILALGFLSNIRL